MPKTAPMHDAESISLNGDHGGRRPVPARCEHVARLGRHVRVASTGRHSIRRCWNGPIMMSSGIERMRDDDAADEPGQQADERASAG